MGSTLFPCVCEDTYCGLFNLPMLAGAIHFPILYRWKPFFLLLATFSHFVLLESPGCSSVELYGYGSIPINTIFSGMNIHLPAILMWTTGVQGFDTLPYPNFFRGAITTLIPGTDHPVARRRFVFSRRPATAWVAGSRHRLWRPLRTGGSQMGWSLQCGAPKIAKLVYKSNN